MWIDLSDQLGSLGSCNVSTVRDGRMNVLSSTEQWTDTLPRCAQVAACFHQYMSL